MKNIIKIFIAVALIVSASSCTSVRMAFNKDARQSVKGLGRHTTPTVYHNIDGCKFCQREINDMLNTGRDVARQIQYDNYILLHKQAVRKANLNKKH